jgi:hypothetical protein
MNKINNSTGFQVLMLVSYVAYSSTMKMEATCPPKCQVTSNGQHGVISQKIELKIRMILSNNIFGFVTFT